MSISIQLYIHQSEDHLWFNNISVCIFMFVFSYHFWYSDWFISGSHWKYMMLSKNQYMPLFPYINKKYTVCYCKAIYYSLCSSGFIFTSRRFSTILFSKTLLLPFRWFLERLLKDRMHTIFLKTDKWFKKKIWEKANE